MSSLLFLAIVAVEEVEVDRQHVPKVDFGEFHELEAQTKVPWGKGHTWRRDNVVGLVFEYRVGGRLGTS